jgi:hypothetical protein
MNKKIILSNFCALSALSLALAGCSSNSYDSIHASDDSAYSYGVKAVIPTGKERVDIVLEYQGAQGKDSDVHEAEFDYSYDGTEYTVSEIRPTITTQDSFSLDAISVGAKWNLLDKRYLGMNIYFNVMHLSTSVDIDIPAYLSVAPSTVQVDKNTIQFAPKFELYVPLFEHIQVTGSILTMGALQDTSLTISSISVDYELAKNLTLGLGYKNWSYYSLESDNTKLSKDILNFSDQSNISLTAKGISGELAYRF